MYKIALENSDDITLNKEEFDKLTVLEKKGDHWVVEYNNKIFKVEVQSFDSKTKSYEMAVNDERVKLQLHNKLDLLIEEMGLNLESEDSLTSLEAPMPGLVVDILVNLDDEVETGTPLLVLEAMKMENIIKAKGNAKVKSIEVSKSEKVDKAQILIEFYKEES